MEDLTMSSLTKFGACAAMALALAAFASAEDKKKDAAKEVVINIVEDGPKAKYVKEGEKEQKDVTVTVGQKVTWKNKGDLPHTATSKTKGDDNKPVFDTAKIDVGGSKSITFDEELYKKLGGKDGKDVEAVYFCKFHGEANMKSKIVLKAKKE